MHCGTILPLLTDSILSNVLNNNALFIRNYAISL